jgi:hypothetical protein
MGVNRSLASWRSIVAAAFLACELTVSGLLFGREEHPENISPGTAPNASMANAVFLNEFIFPPLFQTPENTKAAGDNPGGLLWCKPYPQRLLRKYFL